MVKVLLVVSTWFLSHDNVPDVRENALFSTGQMVNVSALHSIQGFKLRLILMSGDEVTSVNSGVSVER